MKQALLLIFASFLLFGCGQQGAKVTGDPNSPGYTATHYFYALFLDKDLEKASQYTTPKLTRIMRSYGSARQFTRSVMNLSYDKVTIEIDNTDASLREQYGDEAVIGLVFEGYFNDKKIDELRQVKMVKQKGRWYVAKIIADPYAR